MMAIGSDVVGSARRIRLKRRLEIGLARTEGTVSGCRSAGFAPRLSSPANRVANRAECDWMKYRDNSPMVWYSKNRVLESEPKVCSKWFVSFNARIESIPYFSNAARGSM